MTPQRGEVFSVCTELSFSGFQQKVDDSESTKVSLACIASRALGTLNLGAGGQEDNKQHWRESFVRSMNPNPEGTH